MKVNFIIKLALLFSILNFKTEAVWDDFGFYALEAK